MFLPPRQVLFRESNFPPSCRLAHADHTAISTPDATLINGLGRYVDGPSSPLAVVNVTAGKRFVQTVRRNLDDS